MQYCYFFLVNFSYKISLFLIIILFFIFNESYSQQGNLGSYYFFNDFSDTKTSAMGFTSVSNPFSPISHKTNPALLTFDQDLNLYGSSFGDEFIASVSSKLFGLAFAVDYSIIDYSRNFFIPEYGPIDYNDSFYSFNVSKKITRDFSLGTSITFLDLLNDFSYKINFGAVYRIENLLESSDVHNDLFLGFALNNLGPDLTDGRNEIYLPIYIDIGATYRIESGENSLFSYSLETSIKYKNYLNPGTFSDYSFPSPSWDEAKYRDFWGLGFEVTLFKMISLRDGYYKSPYMDNFIHTGGIGIYFPPRVTKFSISIEYMRFWDRRYYFGNGRAYSTSLNLSYLLN